MDNFKLASQEKLRISTPKGQLSVEQLWDLPLSTLDEVAVSLEKAYEESKGKSFLVKRTTKDKGLKLQFDIVLDVLQTKAEEAEQAKLAKERRENNQRILSLIQDKKDEALSKKSIKELEAMLQ